MAANYFRLETGIQIDDVTIAYGSGTPEGNLVAEPGSIYSDISNGNIYKKKTGSTSAGWEELASALEDGYQNTFMGKTGTGSETPTYTAGQGTLLSSGTNLEQAVDQISLYIGPAPTKETRTNNPIVNAGDVNANVDALDSAIGPSSDLTSTNYVTDNSTLMKKISDLDAAVKAAFDGLNGKTSVKLATTAVLTGAGLAATAQQITWTAAAGPTTIDSIGLTNGDRILVKDETGAGALAIADNGIWIRTSQDQWDRADDANTWAELISAYSWVEEGAVNEDSGWLCTVDAGGTIGTTDVTWILYAAAGSIIAGAGLTKAGNTIDVGDADKGVQVNVNDLEIDASEIVGDGLKVGASAWLLAIEPADFAGNGVEDDGSDNLQVKPDVTGGANLATVISVVANGVAVKISDADGLIVENGSNQLTLGDKVRADFTSDNITGITDVDSVLVDDYPMVKWFIWCREVANPANVKAFEIHAIHDGVSGGADATAVDYTNYAVVKLNSKIDGLIVSVDKNLSAGSQVMRLRVVSTDAVDIRGFRMALPY